MRSFGSSSSAPLPFYAPFDPTASSSTAGQLELPTSPEETVPQPTPTILTRVDFYDTHFTSHLRSTFDLSRFPASDSRTLTAARTRWSRAEKDAFFASLARHGKSRPDLIAEDLLSQGQGSSKTVLEVYAYLEILERGANTAPKKRKREGGACRPPPAAREVSERWIEFEESLAADLGFVEEEKRSQLLAKTPKLEKQGWKGLNKAQKKERKQGLLEQQRTAFKTEWLANLTSEKLEGLAREIMVRERDGKSAGDDPPATPLEQDDPAGGDDKSRRAWTAGARIGGQIRKMELTSRLRADVTDIFSYKYLAAVQRSTTSPDSTSLPISYDHLLELVNHLRQYITNILRIAVNFPADVGKARKDVPFEVLPSGELAAKPRKESGAVVISGEGVRAALYRLGGKLDHELARRIPRTSRSDTDEDDESRSESDFRTYLDDSLAPSSVAWSNSGLSSLGDAEVPVELVQFPLSSHLSPHDAPSNGLCALSVLREPSEAAAPGKPKYHIPKRADIIIDSSEDEDDVVDPLETADEAARDRALERQDKRRDRVWEARAWEIVRGMDEEGLGWAELGALMEMEDKDLPLNEEESSDEEIDEEEWDRGNEDGGDEETDEEDERSSDYGSLQAIDDIKTADEFEME